MPTVFDAKPTDPSWLLAAKAIFGVALALASPFVAISLGRTIALASRSQSWPQATATVVRSEVTTDFPVGARGPQFEPRVEYRYAVDGKEYAGRRVALRSFKFTSKEEADRVAATYAPGTEHPAYYDPAAPAESMLERGTGALTYVGLAIPVVMIVVGPLMARDHIRELRRRAGAS